MKKLIAFARILASTADAQTIATVRAKYNGKTCAANNLSTGCTQAEVDAAVVANKTPGGTIYTTDAAFRDGVIVPKVVAAEAEDDLNQDASRLVRAFVGASKAQRSAACSALGITC